MHIFTPTDQAQGDHAVYDLDQAVLVMTGRDLKLTTPNDVLTARDTWNTGRRSTWRWPAATPWW